MDPRTRRLVLSEWQGAVFPNESPCPAADLRKALDQACKRFGFAERLRESVLMDAWAEMVGPTLASHCDPAGIYRGVLTVRVENSGWLHQISFAHKKDILKAVQGRFPHLKVKDLRLRIEGRSRKQQ
ncbi:MAG: DUF721 domain-containing protein [Verrucomicrobiae bacterium]|nr:DUF721 domain-containing protein [Verrucomicrobiae bacterium]